MKIYFFIAKNLLSFIEK